MDNHMEVSAAGGSQLADLLGQALETDGHDPIDAHHAKRARLRLRLGDALRLDSAGPDALAAALPRMCRDSRAGEGPSVGEALLDSRTPLDALQSIKADGKRRSGCDADPVDHDVSIMVYYAAIASAMMFHDRKITSWSYQALSDALASLSQKEWIWPELARHLAKAREHCLRKAT